VFFGLWTIPASSDTITMTVTGSVAPYQFGNGYFISLVIDRSGLFGQAGADLANDPITVLWTFDTVTASLSSVITINGVAGQPSQTTLTILIGPHWVVQTEC
jgi:hypothetical protein